MIFMPDVMGGFDISAEFLGQAKPTLVACLESKARAGRQIEALGAVAARFGERIRVLVVEEGEIPGLRNRLNVLGTPTFLLFQGGRERDRYLGEAESAELYDFVQHGLDQAAS